MDVTAPSFQGFWIHVSICLHVLSASLSPMCFIWSSCFSKALRTYRSSIVYNRYAKRSTSYSGSRQVDVFSIHKLYLVSLLRCDKLLIFCDQYLELKESTHCFLETSDDKRGINDIQSRRSLRWL